MAPNALFRGETLFLTQDPLVKTVLLLKGNSFRVAGHCYCQLGENRKRGRGKKRDEKKQQLSDCGLLGSTVWDQKKTLGNIGTDNNIT